MEELMTIVDLAKFTKLKVATLRKYVARESIPFQRARECDPLQAFGDPGLGR